MAAGVNIFRFDHQPDRRNRFHIAVFELLVRFFQLMVAALQDRMQNHPRDRRTRLTAVERQ